MAANMVVKHNNFGKVSVIQNKNFLSVTCSTILESFNLQSVAVNCCELLSNACGTLQKD